MGIHVFWIQKKITNSIRLFKIHITRGERLFWKNITSYTPHIQSIPYSRYQLHHVLCIIFLYLIYLNIYIGQDAIS